VGYDPELYDLVHTGTPGDVAFYVRASEGAEHVLELGCGSGRVLVALAEAGRRVTGLDNEPGMLEAARRRLAALPEEAASRVTLVEGDMTRFSLETCFDRIFIPFNGLYALLSRAAVTRCFRAVREHLGADGVLLFDGYAADEFHRTSRPEDFPEDRLDEVARVVHRGELLTVLERSRWDRARQTIEATYVYAASDGAVRHQASLAHRYVRRAELERALSDAGLSLIAVHGDFEGGPYDPGHGPMVVLAHRASRRRPSTRRRR
jgi:SAM-dependent methyltransferase